MKVSLNTLNSETLTQAFVAVRLTEHRKVCQRMLDYGKRNLREKSYAAARESVRTPSRLALRLSFKESNFLPCAALC